MSVVQPQSAVEAVNLVDAAPRREARSGSATRAPLPQKRSRDANLIEQWKRQLSCSPEIDIRARLLDSIAQPIRLRLFYLLDRIGEVCVGELSQIVGVSQATVSQHLAKFKAHALVTARRENQSIYYRLAVRPEVEMLRTAALSGLDTPSEDHEA